MHNFLRCIEPRTIQYNTKQYLQQLQVKAPQQFQQIYYKWLLIQIITSLPSKTPCGYNLVTRTIVPNDFDSQQFLLTGKTEDFFLIFYLMKRGSTTYNL